MAIAMSLLLAEAVEDTTWRRQVITFHERPRLVKLPETEDLRELYQSSGKNVFFFFNFWWFARVFCGI